MLYTLRLHIAVVLIIYIWYYFQSLKNHMLFAEKK